MEAGLMKPVLPQSVCHCHDSSKDSDSSPKTQTYIVSVKTQTQTAVCEQLHVSDIIYPVIHLTFAPKLLSIRNDWRDENARDF